MRRGRRPTAAEMQRHVDLFNGACPIGGKVTVRLDNGDVMKTTTRSTACIFSGHTPVVFLEGISGCYLLDRVTPITEGRAP